MNIINSSIRLFFILLLFNCVLSYGKDTCVQKSPCICEFSNGTGIDLTPTAKSSFYTAQNYHIKRSGQQYELVMFYFHPCFDVLPKVNNTNINDTCGIPLSLCRHVNTMDLQNSTSGTYKMDNGVYNYLGSINVTKFSADGSSLTYFNGPSSTTVLLICAQTENKLEVYDLEEPKAIVLAFYSQDACLKQIEDLTGRSLGSTLLIVFFSFVIFYLVLGICTKKFLMGATGIEVIPNLSFWSDLPNLVKDGWMFAISGFKLPARGPGPGASPDPNSYDSI